MSQAMGFMMVFRASSIVGPPVAGLLFEATKRFNFSIKLMDSLDSDLSPESGRRLVFLVSGASYKTSYETSFKSVLHDYALREN